MKFQNIVGLSSALCLGAMTLPAQEASPVEQLKQQLKQIQESFEKQRQLHEQQMEAMRQQIEALQQKQTTVATEQEKLKQKMEIQPSGDAKLDAAMEAKPWKPTDPIRVGRGAAYMDIGLVGTFAAGGSTAKDIGGGLQLGGHDPSQRGFSVQGLEATFSGAVDPYFRGQANVLFQIDGGGETFVELEEAYLESTSLPWNLQLRAGQIFSEFGRQNSQHAHSWAFVDMPLVNGRFLGADGMRNPGARLSWLAPTPFYSELMLSVQNSQGETAASFRSAGGHSHGGEEEAGLPFAYRHPDNDRGLKGVRDLLITPRWVTSFDLTDSQTLVFGLSSAFGPNASGSAGEQTFTQIYGADVYWKWKPSNSAGGFPFVSFQTEGMLRKYRVGAFDWDEDANGGDGDANGFVDSGVLVDNTTGLPVIFPAETLTDYGFYSQLLYGFRKGWVGGLRFDYVTGERANYERTSLTLADNAGGGDAVGIDPERATRWRISPNVTWYPTEFSKFRLQYNYDRRQVQGTDHSVWLQFEFVLGAHAAHKF